jgi:hypothetical protein
MSYFETCYRRQDDMMVENGEGLLRLIQNNDMVPMDLLVRESVQNSLDAARNIAEPVTVTFTVRKLYAAVIAEIIPELSDGLKQNDLDNRQVLEIRDTGTTGLTGPISFGLPRPENNGPNNLVNLVYQISRPQRGTDAGGAWGLGKTVYYRMGMGIVFYYTRVKSGAEYEERLIACLVEDTDSAQRLMSVYGPTDTGITWWGGENIKDKPSALTDPLKIREIVEKLGFSPFLEDQTGTAVIIPFLRNDLLPPKPSPGDAEEIEEPIYNIEKQHIWYTDIKGYIKFSLLKWYAVRIGNEFYPALSKKPKLIALVQGHGDQTPQDISKEMPRLFSVIQCLYNMAGGNRPFFGTKPEPGQEDILRDSINLQQTFKKPVNGKTDTSAGKIVAVRLTPDQLGMGPGSSDHSPFLYLLNEHDTIASRPFIGYLRSPGMIVCWNDSDWQKNLKRSEDGKYILALFVPNSYNILNSDKTLEEYLRSTEMADHSSWHDNKGNDVLLKIRNNCKSEINKKFIQKATRGEEYTDISFGSLAYSVIARPGEGGQGGKKVKKKSKDGNSQLRRGENPAFGNYNFTYPSPDEINMDWELKWGRNKCKSHFLTLNVAAEGGIITPSEWKEGGVYGVFPFNFGDVTASVVIDKKGDKKLGIDHLVEINKLSDTVIELINNNGGDIDGSTIKGSLIVKIISQDEISMISPYIKRENKVGEGGNHGN